MPRLLHRTVPRMQWALVAKLLISCILFARTVIRRIGSMDLLPIGMGTRKTVYNDPFMNY